MAQDDRIIDKNPKNLNSIFSHVNAILYFFVQTLLADIRNSEQSPGINIQNKQSSRPERSKQGWIKSSSSMYVVYTYISNIHTYV